MPHFGVWGTMGLAYDLQIQTQARFLYYVLTHQVSSPVFIRSEFIALTNKQTHRQ